MGCPIGKWRHGPSPAQPWLFNFEPRPFAGSVFGFARQSSEICRWTCNEQLLVDGSSTTLGHVAYDGTVPGQESRSLIVSCDTSSSFDSPQWPLQCSFHRKGLPDACGFFMVRGFLTGFNL